jgi:hypothetical protein
MAAGMERYKVLVIGDYGEKRLRTLKCFIEAVPGFA